MENPRRESVRSSRDARPNVLKVYRKPKLFETFLQVETIFTYLQQLHSIRKFATKYTSQGQAHIQ